MMRVTIIGVGLIGGSLGLALKRHPKKYRITGWGRSRSKLLSAQRRRAVDDITTDIKIAVKDADVVVLCVPVQTIVPLTKRLLPFLKAGAVITDVGSVKKDIVAGVKKVLMKRSDVSFVGAHPIAGSEKTGVQNARADLFKNACCVIATDSASRNSFQKIFRLWKDTGAACVALPSAAHDRFLALTSHLPHLISFAYFGVVKNAADEKPIVKSLVAGSFRDMTRVAAGDAELWSGIVDLNRQELKKVKHLFLRGIDALINAPAAKLKKQIQKLSDAKRRW